MTIAPIDQRLAALSVDSLNKVVAMLPGADPADVLRNVNLHAREIERLRQMHNGMQQIIDERTEALHAAKRSVATDIYHLWNIGEIADAMQEAGL